MNEKRVVLGHRVTKRSRKGYNHVVYMRIYLYISIYMISRSYYGKVDSYIYIHIKTTICDAPQIFTISGILNIVFLLLAGVLHPTNFNLGWAHPAHDVEDQHIPVYGNLYHAAVMSPVVGIYMS
jgi:hypothetical protein